MHSVALSEIGVPGGACTEGQHRPIAVPQDRCLLLDGWNNLCLATREEHDGPCPSCGGSGEYEGEYGPKPCMGCLTGWGPYGHAFSPALSTL